MKRKVAKKKVGKSRANARTNASVLLAISRQQRVIRNFFMEMRTEIETLNLQLDSLREDLVSDYVRRDDWIALVFALGALFWLGLWWGVR